MKEVSAKIEAVKSARVKFHEEVIWGEFKVQQQQVNQPCAHVSSCQSSDPNGFVLSDQNQNDEVGDTVTPQDWAAFTVQDTSILSAMPKSANSLQTELSMSESP